MAIVVPYNASFVNADKPSMVSDVVVEALFIVGKFFKTQRCCYIAPFFSVPEANWKEILGVRVSASVHNQCSHKQQKPGSLTERINNHKRNTNGIYYFRDLRNEESNRYRNLTNEPSDMITQLWGLLLAKQHDLCITIERHAIRIEPGIHLSASTFQAAPSQLRLAQLGSEE